MTEDEVRTAYTAANLSAQAVFSALGDLPILPRIARTRAADELEMRARGITPSWYPLVSVVIAPLSGPDELMTPKQTSPSGFEEPFGRYLGRGRSLRGQGYFQIDAFGLIDEQVAGDPGEASEISETEPPRVVSNRLRIYRQGVLEWAHRYLVRDEYGIPSTSFAQDVHNAFAYSAEIYSTLGYYGPVGAWVRIDNAESARLDVPQRFLEMQPQRPTGMESINAYHQAPVDLMLEDPLPLVRNAMERIWQAFGYQTCLLFDEDGNWTGPE
jgi:hypothetical protein